VRRITQFDNSVWDKGIEVWKSILEYRRANKNPSNSQLEYFNLYIDYLEKLQRARDEGDFIVAHNTSIPAEIFYAMDMVPYLLVGTCFAITQCVRQHPKFMEIAKEFGMSDDTCSAHRNIIAHAVQGVLPKPDVFVDIGCVCDAFSSSTGIASDLYGVECFKVDAPYYNDEKSIEYLANEYKELIQFLEQKSGRKMDWDRLVEMLHNSQKMIDLAREVWEIRKAVPTPMDNRRAWETNWINWFFSGTPEGVRYWEVLRDELKDRVERGVGAYPDVEERFRILDLCMAPAFDLGVLEWMQEEWGANIVAEEYIYYAPDLKLEPENPLETMAVRWFEGPLFCLFQGRLDIYCKAVVQSAEEFKIDGAIWWDQKACRQAGVIKIIQDSLEREAGVPVGRIDVDITDPGYVGKEELRSQLTTFFEILESRKG